MHKTKVRKILFFAPHLSASVAEKYLDSIMFLQKLQYDVSFIVPQKKHIALTKREKHHLDEYGDSYYSPFNDIILDITSEHQDVCYALTQSIVHSKHILCLYAKNSPPKQLLFFLHKFHLDAHITISPFSVTNIHSTILSFLEIKRSTSKKHSST